MVSSLNHGIFRSIFRLLGGPRGGGVRGGGGGRKYLKTDFVGLYNRFLGGRGGGGRGGGGRGKFEYFLSLVLEFSFVLRRRWWWKENSC